MPLVPRNRAFDFSQVRDPWFAGDPWRSRVFDAFSTLLPIGERFFVDSVRRVEDRIADPALRADIVGFAAQEAVHAREHRRYNERVYRSGLEQEALDRSQHRVFDRLARARDPLVPLAFTVALEHVTAEISRLALRGELWGSDTDATMREFWEWHAADEIEHRSVAYDVFVAAGGTERLRRTMFVAANLGMSIRVASRLVRLLRRDGRLADARVWWSGLRWTCGLTAKVGPGLAAYLRRGFRPDRAGQSRLGILFDVMREMGEDTTCEFRLQRPDGTVVETRRWDHADHDGYSASTVLLADLAVRAPAWRVGTRPSRRARLRAVRAATRESNPDPLRRRLAPTGWQLGDRSGERLAATAVLDAERSQAVRGAAALAGVSMTTWLLWAADRAIAPRIADVTAGTRWCVPVHMRGNGGIDPGPGNRTSAVTIGIGVADRPGDVSAKLKDVLFADRHWGKWDQAQLLLRLGSRAARRRVQWYYDTFDANRIGSYTYIGEWAGSTPPDVGIAPVGVPTKADPVAVTAGSWNGLLGVSVAAHPSLTTDADHPKQWLRAWIDHLLSAPSPGCGTERPPTVSRSV